MVGGTSRIPLITELLISKVGFTREKLNLGSMNPDEAVAKGATLLAAQISKNSKVIRAAEGVRAKKFPTSIFSFNYR